MRISKIIYTLISILSTLSVYASDLEFESEGLIYRVLDEEARTLEFLRPQEKYVTEINIPGNILQNGKKYTVTKVATAALKGTIGGYSVILPNTVECIGDSAFFSTSLLSIELPNSLHSIGEVAFSNCHQLKSIYIPKNLTNIAKHAFLFCRSMQDFSVDDENSVYSSSDGILYDKNKTELLWYPGAKTASFTIPNTVNTIGEYAFAYNSLKSISIPDNINTIKYGAFYASRELTSVLIPSSISEIGNSAFAKCAKLTSITIPSSVISMGDAICRGCINLEEINIDENNPNYKSVDGILFNKGGDLLIEYPCARLGKYSIPNSVTIIGNSAFENASISDIEIPNSVKTIGKSAFYYCGMLKSINLPLSVEAIGPYAFSGAGITSMSIPQNVSSIKHHTFFNCSNLESISLPNELDTIQAYTFSGCAKLTSILIPKTVTNIGNDAFNYCKMLSSIEIPASVKCIGERAFNNCSTLTEIFIPNFVDSIGSWVFSNCSNLQTVSLPNSIQHIGDNAFWNCPSLIEINYNSSNPINCNAGFSDSNLINSKLYIPFGTTQKFNKVDPWRNFFNIEEKDFPQSSVDEILSAKEKYSVYSMNGDYISSSLQDLPTGVYIVKMRQQAYKVYIRE